MKFILSDTSIDFSLDGLRKLHFLLFNGISNKAGEFRKNIIRGKKKMSSTLPKAVLFALTGEV